MSFGLRSRALAALGVGVLAAGLANAPAGAASAGWAQPGYSSAQNFYNPAESVINAGSINSVGERWSVPLPELEESCSGPSEPLAYGGKVFVTDDTGIGAYKAGTGQQLWHWSWDLPDNETTPHLAVAGGLLVAGNTECQSQSDPNGGIVALNITNGEPRWSIAAGGPVESLVVDKGMVVVAGSSAASDHEVRAFRLSDGKRRWSLVNYATFGISSNGKLLVSRTNGAGSAALDITTGKKLWNKAVHWWPLAIAPAGDMFYAIDLVGRLFGAKMSNGAVAWTNPLQTEAQTWIATDGKRVHRTVVNGIEALDAKKGKRIWVRYFEGDTAQPVRAGGLLYTNVDAGEPVGVLNAANGKVVSAGHQFGPHDGGNVVISGGWLYRVDGHTLRAYAP